LNLPAQSGSIEPDRVEFPRWIEPTVNRVALPLADYRTVDAAAAWNALTSRNTRPANLFGQCAISIPIQREPAALPVGLQIVCNGGEDRKLLSIALAIEEIRGLQALDATLGKWTLT
jgi:aspartyl-tRNA(Asn)/glutamyl-tRNA(Gln) amidotransferase subunit A